MLHPLIPVLLAQLGGGAVDSVYANAALRSVIERAALVNRSGPVSLSGFRARLEAMLGSLPSRDRLTFRWSRLSP